MKRILFLLIAICMGILYTIAYDFRVDGVCYNITSKSTPAVEVTSGSYTQSDIVIPASVTYEGVTYAVTSIGQSAFRGNEAFTSVILPNSIDSIGSQAFMECGNLSSVVIPKSVSKLDYSSFACCDKLISLSVEEGNSIYDSRNDCNAIIETATNTLVVGCPGTNNIPENITTIGEGAFYKCKEWRTVTIPKSVARIENYAFYRCDDLAHVYYQGNIEDWLKIEFEYYSSNPLCRGAKLYIDSRLVTHVDIPRHITKIPDYVFDGYSSLTSVTIPEGVDTIGISAFWGCSGLTYVAIPNSVTDIGMMAFKGCTNLDTLRVRAMLPPTMGVDNFNHRPQYVYVPCGAEKTYISANWGDGNLSTTSFIESDYEATIVPQSSNTGKRSKTFALCGKPLQITATPEYGYHFEYWADGNKDNPRVVDLTSDSTFAAVFMPNQYTISGDVSDAERGKVEGGATVDYLGEVSLTAVANYGYHFAYWTDWNTENPRIVQATEDKTYTAVFEKNIYSIVVQSANSTQGDVYAPAQAEYLDDVTLVAIPTLGYHFAQWTDANIDNPRTIALTSDTAFTAEFAQTFSGQCGDSLYWSYKNHTLTISGTGTMYDYHEDNVPWLLFRDTTDAVLLERGITHIGTYAFKGFVKLQKIELPNTLTSIGANAFTDCRNMVDVYAYSIEPPVAENSSFTNYNVYVHIPCDNLRAYQLDAVFGTFKYVRCISADSADTDDLVVTPSDNEADFIWPSDDDASTYTLNIYKDGEIFCTLVFNAKGQLKSIAFAPARNGHKPQYGAEQTPAGFHFTVTGLTQATYYKFDMNVEDANQTVLQTYTGEFTTTNGLTSVEQIDDNQEAAVRKVFRDGQVYILRGGKTYTLTGIEVK